MKREEILRTAEKLISVDRKESYGDLRNNFETCAHLWSAWIEGRFGVSIDLEAEDVAIMNSLIKVARLSNNITHEDSWVDICGYAALGGELASGDIGE